MAQITITIPDAIAAKIGDAYASRFNWTASPELPTKLALVKQKVIQNLAAVTGSYEEEQAMIAARSARTDLSSIT